ncbi:MAG TPA: hypothetical protein VGJ93_08580 [Desulfuromonadaceae bacterium]|jgi:hypothetical protein
MRLYFLFGAIICFAILEGCGSGSSVVGEGNTVYLEAGITSGSNLSADSLLSSAAPDILDFTIKSTAFSNAGGFASDVQINQQDISYEYLGSSDPTFNLIANLPAYQTFSTGILPPGGSLDLQIRVTQASTKQFISTNYLSAFSTLPTNVLRYKINIRFTGTEIKTNKRISVTTFANLFVKQ